MTTQTPTEGKAEALLRQLQEAFDAEGRAGLRAAERASGAGATRAGRLLHDLISGSHAWDLFEQSRGRALRRLPRVHTLCVCEPVLRAMRESGEMAERERLLAGRDAALAAVWRDPSGTEEERWRRAEDVRDEYQADVEDLAERHRAHYETLGQAASRSSASLAPPRVRSRPLLQPPLMTLLFRACHGDTAAEGEWRQGGDTLSCPSGAPELDPAAWDLAALAVSAFYARTSGDDPDAGFPLLVDDYFEWRATDPRKRSRTARAALAARLEFLSSDRLRVRSEGSLWRTDPETGRRAKTPVFAERPFLTLRSRIFRRPGAGEEGAAEPETLGYLISLGEWAKALVEGRATPGLHLKRLAEYDLARQGWERRIGWFLVFQMTDQAAKMTFQDVTREGRTRTLVTPQHPLKMQTILSGSLVPWEETARTNPGKVLRQWQDALDTLRRDGVIGPWSCLDGAEDGSDLPTRGRLAAMLERRYQIVPGRDLLPHLRANQGGAGIGVTSTPLRPYPVL